MNAFEAGGIQETGGVADDHPAIAAERREGPPSAVRERFGAIADHVAAFEKTSYIRMLFEGLEDVLGIDARILIVESGNEAERDDVGVGAIAF
jgi:hypothetical protein